MSFAVIDDNLKNIINIIETYAEKNNFIEFSGKGNIDDFIIQSSSKTELKEKADSLFRSIHTNIEQNLFSLLKSNMQFTHIREQGLRIWGKGENVGFGKVSIVELFQTFKEFINNDAVYEKALYIAGRKAAYGFFDEFRAILLIDNSHYYPKKIITFLNLLASFDSRSSWWEDVKYSSYDDPFRLTAVINKPFTNYPWTSKNINSSRFLEGYLITLANMVIDYLRCLSLIKKEHFNENYFAYEIKSFDEPSCEDEFIQIKFCNYISDFENIDLLNFYCGENITFADDTTLKECLDQLNIYIDSLNSLLASINKELNKDIKLYRNQLNNIHNNLLLIRKNLNKTRPDFVKIDLVYILKSIRFLYDDLRVLILSDIYKDVAGKDNLVE